MNWGNKNTMIRQKLATAIVLVTAIIVGLLPAVPVSAATSSSGGGNGLKISPVRSDLTISPGQSKTISVVVQNVTSSTANLQAIINDFVAGTDESGVPKILLNPNQYAPTHSLKHYIAPIGDVSIPANQSKEVKVTINIPKDAAGGGYFGVVRFAPASAGKGNVSLAASVGSLILVTVPGDIKENMTIASFDARTITTDKNGQVHERSSTIFTSPKNINAVVRFNNQGNVQEQPFGKVELKNRSGKVLATYEINNTTPRGNVLPSSIRKFAVPLTKVGSFGKYTLVGNFGFGSKGQLLTAKTSFYVIPLGLIIGLIVLVILIVLAIIYLPRFVRGYNRRVLRRAGRR
ncbi:MAG TPA: DUF916 domain-containing protein [Candidatus Saccharimonadales bacterium]|nr:DUF916 domain-containing protein [Candidatus Saccharimonadales bacterium]